jgi:predicted CoA-binding protein
MDHSIAESSIMEKRVVIVLGASPKEDRYSHQAVKLLLEKGYEVIPVNPAAPCIAGLTPVKRLEDVSGGVDTVTMYVNGERAGEFTGALLALRPRRVVFNPGTESSTLARVLSDNGIEVVEGCTLVMLRTGQF